MPQADTETWGQDFLYPDLPSVPENLRNTQGSWRVWFRYNDANNTINRVHWNIPAMVEVTVTVRDRITDELILTDIRTGPTAGDQAVPGNAKYEDLGEGYPELPWNVRFVDRKLWGNL